MQWLEDHIIELTVWLIGEQYFNITYAIAGYLLVVLDPTAQYCSTMGNETMVEVDKPQKFSEFATCRRAWKVSNYCNFLF